MPRTSDTKIQSVFSKNLGMVARDLEKDGLVTIIKPDAFPEGAPIHEDGSSVYDPKKPLVLFAVCLTTPEGRKRWRVACRDHDRMQALARVA